MICYSPFLAGFFIAGDLRLHAFPRAQEVEIAEFLDQRYRLVYDTAQRVVIADLDMTGQREILAKRMPFEAVIRQQTAQVGVTVVAEGTACPSPTAARRRSRMLLRIDSS
jgi:hypothetical protein